MPGVIGIGETVMKALVTCFGLAAIVLSSSNAYAIPIGVVGATDTQIAATSLANSGSATEAAWIASVLGVDVNTINYTKLSGSGGTAWQQVTGGASGLWALDFGAAGVTNPLVFLVKFGNASTSHVLFQNNPSMQYGVIDLGTFTPRNGRITISSVSHVATAGKTTRVPEPASWSVLLVGLAGVGATTYRRRVRT